MIQTKQKYENDNINYWTERSGGYSEVNKSELRTEQRRVWSNMLQERISERFPNKHNREIRVLDIGTGPGFFAIILAEAGYMVTAVDYTESMLEKARYNAGSLLDKINFMRMNAEELEFEDDSFDVIVSRNLTWNLLNPEKAYRQWKRVLKPGGLMLVFDANWYRYLYDDKAREGYLRDRENIKRYNVANETDGTDIPAMEAIAYQAPLSMKKRPEWDRVELSKLGMSVRTDEAIWNRVWTKEECINNSSTPMFMVEAVK